MTASHPATYSRLQILLHWVIALIVFFQLIFGEAIGDLGRALRKGETPEASVEFLANAHIWLGVTVLVLMVLRIALKLTRGAPALVPGPRWQQILAHSVHGILYLLLLIAPITGLVAWFGGVHLSGEVHELLKPLFILTIVAHVAGALWHQFVSHDGTLMRMMPGRN